MVTDPNPPTLTPLSPMQQITIANLRRGQEHAVPVTLFAEAPAAAVLDLVAASKRRSDSGPRMTVAIAIALLLVRTLMDHPAMRRGLVDDTTVAEYADVHLGIAVAKDDNSLVVPVVHNASALSASDLSAAIADRISRARSGTLSLSDVKGGTFTLSSTGGSELAVYGTPLLSPRQAGILLVGRASLRAIVDESGDVRTAPLMPLSLTIDHAVVNGQPAIEFLADLVERIAEARQHVTDPEGGNLW